MCVCGGQFRSFTTLFTSYYEMTVSCVAQKDGGGWSKQGLIRLRWGVGENKRERERERDILHV